MGTKIRVMVIEADDVDAGTMARVMEMISGRAPMGQATRQIEKAASAPLPAAPKPAPKVERLPSARPDPRSGGIRPRRFYKSGDFPGKVFTAEQVREICGLGERTALTTYVQNGAKIGRKHVFEYADGPATEEATQQGGQDAGDDNDEDDDGGGDDEDDPPEGWASSRLWLRLKGSFGRRRDRIRNVLIERNMGMVRTIAGIIHAKLPEEVELDDLVSAGVLGLVDAINKFDALRGNTFGTFAGRRLHGAIHDHLREMDWAPRLVRQRERKLHGAQDVLRNRLGREPGDDEVGEELGLPSDAVEKLIRDGKVIAKRSMATPVYRNDRVSMLGDTLADDDAEHVGAQDERRDWWERVTRGLPRAEKVMLALYYREGMTMKQVGQAIGISESRVSQMMANLLDQLRSRMTAKEWLGDEAG